MTTPSSRPAHRAIAVVQARLGSTRLPGKALVDLAGRPMLAHVLARAGEIDGVERVVLATTERPEDDALVELARAAGAACIRGSAEDVLDRFHDVVLAYPGAVLVRVTGDCPLLDPAVSARVLATFRELERASEIDYVGNVDPPTYPDGLDTEVVTAAALERAWSEASLTSDREHVTLYIRRHQDRFSVKNVRNPRDLSALRWTVDTGDDLAFVREVYAELAPDGGRLFGMDEVLALLGRRPELTPINAGIARNEGLALSLARDAELARTSGGPSR